MAMTAIALYSVKLNPTMNMDVLSMGLFKKNYIAKILEFKVDLTL